MRGAVKIWMYLLKMLARNISRIKHRIADYLEQEIFNGFPEDNF